MKSTLWRAIFLLVLFLVSQPVSFCQVPEAINYQAVVRDNTGNVISNQTVSFRLSIRKGSVAGSVVFCETHVKTTNQLGLATIEIGRGTVVSGTFSAINWGADSYFLQTEMDLSGGINYTVTGISQFLSVPYAEYAKAAGNAMPAGSSGQTLRNSGSTWISDSFLFNDGTKIGIGTTIPGYQVDISGDLNFTGTIRKNGVALAYGVSGVSAASPLSSTGGSSPTISIPAATSTVNGYLTKTDWAVFNGKEPSIVAGSGNKFWFSNKTWAEVDWSYLVNKPSVFTPATHTHPASDVISGTLDGNRLPSMSISKPGGVPATGTPTGKYLKDDGTWATSASGISWANLTETSSSVLTITGGTGAVYGTGTLIQVLQASTTQSGYLGSTDWNTFNNKVTSIAATTPLSSTGGKTPTLSIAKATSTVNGYLSNTDWTIFNSKVSSQWTTNGQNIYYNAGNIGLGVQTPLNKLDIGGSAVIGASYAGTATAPANGLLVQGKVAIGTTTPETAAALEVKSTTQGFLPPRMNKAQRDAISNPPDGLMIFCSDCDAPYFLQCFYGGKWNPLATNHYPGATNVSQTGQPYLTYTMYGLYTYMDADNDPEGQSLYKWYRADNSAGLNATVIAGATGQTYVLTTTDANKYIRFSVTPVAQTGATTGDEIKSSAWSGPIVNWLCGNPFIDLRDNKSYGTVLIGTQCWLKQNLNIGVKITGTSSPQNNGIIEKYCYNDEDSNCDTYGGLYLWDEMMNYSASSNSSPSGVQGICLAFWHLPSDAEWCTMTTYLDPNVSCTVSTWSGTDGGGKMKETGNTHWNTPNLGATNSSGFTALPAGYRVSNGSFSAINVNNYISSSTECVSTTAYYRNLYYNYSTVARGSNAKTYGYSVRCVKD